MPQEHRLLTGELLLHQGIVTVGNLELTQLDTNLEHKVLRTIVQDRFSSHMKFYREHTTHDIFNDDVTLYSRMAYCILRSHVLNPTSDVTSPFENQLAAYYRSLNLGCSYGEIALLVYPMPYGITEHGEEVI